MSELEDKINSVLGDPEQFEKIAKLAKSFMGGEGGDAPHPSPGSGGLDSILGGLGGDDAMPGLDPDMLKKLGSLIGGSGSVNKEERAVLEAMRPYLSEKRRGKMDKALKIAKLAGLAKLAIGEFGGYGDD